MIIIEEIGNNKKAFTLIELLVVVAIIGILAAVGVVAYNGYTSGAKKAASISNFKSISKYITSEVMKCSMGESKAMENNLDCSKQGSYNWKDDVANATINALKDFKNPYNTAEKNPITVGGQYWYDNNVGYVRIHTPGSNVEVYVCVATPCDGNNNPNIFYSGIIEIN